MSGHGLLCCNKLCPYSGYKSAATVNTSEDDSSDAESAPRKGSSLTNGRDSVCGHGTPGDLDVSECVRELCRCGQAATLQWLQAYLTDEARDRAMDGELWLALLKFFP